MGKRIFLFVLTNIAVILVLTVVFGVLSLFGINLWGYQTAGGQLDLVSLAIFSLVWGMGGAFISLQMSRWMAKKMMGVQLVDGQSGNPTLDWLYHTVVRQARQQGLPEPEIGVYDSPEVNAFATGPSKRRSLVAVSTGLLNSMQQNEAEAVLAHEVGHIRNGDMVTMTLLQGVINAFVIFLARVIAFAVRQAVDSRIAWMVSFAVMIILQIVLGILGSMVVAAFSRYREFRADAAGAEIAGRDNMVAALRRLQANTEKVETGHPALAALKINGTRGWMALFSTHPPLERRIAALEGRTSV